METETNFRFLTLTQTEKRKENATKAWRISLFVGDLFRCSGWRKYSENIWQVRANSCIIHINTCLTFPCIPLYMEVIHRKSLQADNFFLHWSSLSLTWVNNLLHLCSSNNNLTDSQFEFHCCPARHSIMILCGKIYLHTFVLNYCLFFLLPCYHDRIW